MKKLFGRDKPKANKTVSPEVPTPIQTPIHQQHAVYHDEERWEVVSYDNQEHPRRSDSFGSNLPPRSPSPIKPASIREQAVLKRKPQKPPSLNGAPVAALGILRALDPDSMQHHPRTKSEERLLTNSGDSIHRGSDIGHGEKKKQVFWTQRAPGDRPRDESGEELTRLIGYLTATASEDWGLVLEVCERASVSDSNAKEAVRALRREFKYGEPSAQLSAARLWAIMLRNSTETFISQSTSRKFLDTLEDLLLNPRTSPVVRERVMDVLSAAAYASGSKKDTGFRGLWRRVKPPGKPDEGVPFDTDDAMFNPPSLSGNPNLPTLTFQDPTPITPESGMPYTPQPVLQHQQAHTKDKDKDGKKHRRKSPNRNRIIPPEEDIRRLFQECKIGQGNASLLSQALAMSSPEELEDLKTGGRGGVIREFHAKCVSSQELICAQIEWATAGAERSRALKNAEKGEQKQPEGDEEQSPPELTVEEQLLAALLGANADLLEALKQYDDLIRVGLERKVEDRSRKEVRLDRRLLSEEGTLDSTAGGSRSREPSPTPSQQSRSRRRPESLVVAPTPQYPGAGLSISVNTAVDTLAPPPAAPAGPRSPAQTSLGGSRTPSPASPSMDSTTGSEGYVERMRMKQEISSGVSGEDEYQDVNEEDLSDGLEEEPLMKPSAKALGKRRVVEPDENDSLADTDDLFYTGKDDNSSIPDDDFHQHHHHPDSDDSSVDDRWPGHHHPPVNFVYDAVAERTKQRLREEHENLLVNGIH